MRRITDPRGRTWDVVLGRESFGALYALFVPARGNPDQARQALLRADSQAAADEELQTLSDNELTDLLDRSEPKSV